jgi:hypothetical protein
VQEVALALKRNGEPVLVDDVEVVGYQSDDDDDDLRAEVDFDVNIFGADTI